MLLSLKIGGRITKTALIHEPPGSGKTCMTTAVVEEIESEYGVPTVTADCWTVLNARVCCNDPRIARLSAGKILPPTVTPSRVAVDETAVKINGE